MRWTWIDYALLATTVLLFTASCVAPAPSLEIVSEGTLQPGESITLGPVTLSSETYVLRYELSAPEGEQNETQRITFIITGPPQ